MSQLAKQNIVMFLASFAILFVELVLIRWVSTEIRIFAYLQNFVLLACFLGIGFGCAQSQKKINLGLCLLLMAVLIGAVMLPIYIVFDGVKLHIFKGIPTFLAAFNDTVIHYQNTLREHLRLVQVLGVLLTLVIFIINMGILFPLGQLMGKVFDEHPNTIQAYSVNVLASLLGVWFFSGLSFVYTAPWVWFLLSVILIAGLIQLTQRWNKFSGIAIVLCLLGVIFLFISTENRAKNGMTMWSAYQKLTLRPMEPYLSNIDPYVTRSDVGYELDVNGVGFMFLANLSDKFRREYPDYFEKHSFYKFEKPGPTNSWNLPYSIKKDAKSVLILGAGAGDDAAAAVRNGLSEIDIVEIDPGIVELGRKYHPEGPYSKENVNIIVDDARSYLNHSIKKYDVIHFGLLDSHSQASSMNNIRMDHYVYTLESFQEAKKLLKPDGILLVSFYVQRLWLGQRVGEIIEKTFGWEPLVIGLSGKSGKGKVLMVSGPNRDYVLNIIKTNPEIFSFIKEHTIGYKDVIPNLRMTTDNWPYMYLTRPMIPTMHLIMIFILIVLLFIARGFLFSKGEKIQWHFFFLGGAFLLLEFQNINKTSLLFGSTWLVNSINISAILLLILLANIVASKVKTIKVIYPYLCLMVCLVAIYFIPLEVYRHFSFWPRIILASAMLNLPIFFAGIIFVTSFKSIERKHLAYGSNLIGAAAGGLLEYLSYLFGVQSLVLVALLLYGLSYTFIKK